MKVLTARMMRYGFLVIGLAALFMMAACSSGGSSSGTASGSTNSGSEFVGSWALSDSAGVTTFYLYIEANNTFVGADVPDKRRVHFSGTWSVTNGTFKGPFTNPGVGNGDLICTLANGVMAVDFIEYWHSPAKHVPYTGRKI